MVQYLPIYEQKYRKLIKHMLSTFKAEKRGLDKHTQPELKKGVLIKKKVYQRRNHHHSTV